MIFDKPPLCETTADPVFGKEWVCQCDVSHGGRNVSTELICEAYVTPGR